MSAFLLSSCDEPGEFIFDPNTIPDHFDHEYWANEIILLRSRLNLKEGEVLKTEITLSVSGANSNVNIKITKGYNALFDEFLIRLYKYIYSFQTYNEYNEYLRIIKNEGNVVLDFELGENYIAVLYQPEKNKNNKVFRQKNSEE
jgi:hypothetical protein